MVSPARIKTNRLLAKAFDLNNFLDPTRLAHDELQYYNDLTRLFDKIISHHINWLDSPEARKLFYEDIQNREEYFQAIDQDLDDIIRDTSLSADKIIEKVYRKGLNYGYKDINRLPVFNDACKYGLKATQEYNFELIQSVSDDLKDGIRHHIFRGIAEGQSIHEVARAITDSGLQPLKNKTLSAYQRASLIARTEIARSMTTGRLQSYANYGVKKVKILTAGDDDVCPICRKAEKKIYTLEEASNLVPFHPACRCSVIAHIEHYKPPEKYLDDVDAINLVPNDNFINRKYSYQSAEDEFNKLLNDPSVKCSKGHKLDSHTKIYENDETFYKYEFEDITIYKSETLIGVPVEIILDYYRAIGYDKIKNSCKEIVLSNIILYNKGEPIAGYVAHDKPDRIYLMNADGGLSVTDAMYNLYHEIGHCFDKNYRFSKNINFRKSHMKDYSEMSNPSRHFTDNQRNISSYVNDKINDLGETYENLSAEDRTKYLNSIYSELFAECIRELLYKHNIVMQIHKNKYDYIDNIIRN